MTAVGTTVIRSNRVISRNVDIDWPDIYIFILFCFLSRGQLKNVVNSITHFRIVFRLKKSITYSGQRKCSNVPGVFVGLGQCFCRRCFRMTFPERRTLRRKQRLTDGCVRNSLFSIFLKYRFQIYPSLRYKPLV